MIVVTRLWRIVERRRGHRKRRMVSFPSRSPPEKSPLAGRDIHFRSVWEFREAGECSAGHARANRPGLIAFVPAGTERPIHATNGRFGEQMAVPRNRWPNQGTDTAYLTSLGPLRLRGVYHRFPWRYAASARARRGKGAAAGSSPPECLQRTASRSPPETFGKSGDKSHARQSISPPFWFSLIDRLPSPVRAYSSPRCALSAWPYRPHAVRRYFVEQTAVSGNRWPF